MVVCSERERERERERESERQDSNVSKIDDGIELGVQCSSSHECFYKQTDCNLEVKNVVDKFVQ